MRLQKLILVLAVIGVSLSSRSQLLSTKGKEFWTSFMAFNLPENSRLFIYISAERTCTGVIEDPGGVVIKNFTVSPDSVIRIEVPVLLFYTYEAETIHRLGLHIMATDSISVIAENHEGHFAFEATPVFPLASLGSDYMILSYNSSLAQVASPLYSEFMLVGVEDNTVVEIRPSQPSSKGTAASPFTITLNKGETYLYKGKNRLDISGSEVHVINECKKLAVFAGGQYIIFADCEWPNHLIEQCFPLNTLGTQFLVTPALSRDSAHFRVMATQNNTAVYVNNVLKVNLGKGGIYDQNIAEPVIVHTSRPSVTAFMEQINKCSQGETSQLPYILYVTPVEQSIGSVAFSTIDDQLTETISYVNIHTRTAYSDQTILDGKNIGTLFTVFPADPAYSYVRIELKKGRHALSNANGFTAYEYGYGKNYYLHEGYGFSLGSSLNKSNQFSMVNGISSNLQKDFYFCPLQSLKFEAIRQDTLYSKVYWFFGDGTKDSGNVVNKSFAAGGCYTVQMISYYTGTSGNCLLGDNATDTTTMNVCVQPEVPLSLGPDIYSCADSTVQLQPKDAVPPGFIYQWSNNSFMENITVNKAGTYWLQIQNGECRAVDSINVQVQGTPVLNAGTDKFLCIGDSVFVGNSINEPDVQYSWSNGATGYSQYVKEPGLYTLTATRHDCIATTSVGVKLLKCPGIYVPTAFTPNNDGRNDIIRPVIAGLSLDYFRVYNRWGQLVYQTSAPMAGWNGIFNNQEQDTGVYVYVVGATDTSGKKITRKGTFVLLR